MDLARQIAPVLKQLAPVLKTYLSPKGLKRLFTRSSADPGRERYRRAGMTASTSYIAKGLTLLMGFVSVPLTVDYLGAERYGVWLTISSLLLWGSPDRFRFRRQCSGKCAVGGGRKRRPGVGASLRRVCILGAGHHRPNYWRGPYGRLPFHSLASHFPRVGCHLDPGTGVDLRFGAGVVCGQLTIKPGAIAL